ncbi:hypothetical protein [Wolbachia endosymbiont (group B) of Dolichovespula media]|uniref:hypothetical protein n=1 Tax=Wolbachia endosymbiont (group B) of Dolichovespula media TaxID=2954001 RepID=UPI0021F888ED|nr:hypothetical protein [Wolbachia endosymbiont (group B) of Dolichovespula media]
MPGSGNKDNVTLVSHTTVSENSAATSPTPAPRNTALQTSSASESSSYEERQEESNGANIEPIYASIDPNTKSPKKSRDNQIDSQHPTLSRSPSQKTVYSEPWNSQKTSETLEKLMKAHTTPPPSYKTDDSENSLLEDNKKTNRFLQKVKYTMQKKKVTMPFVGLVTACCITSIVLAVKQREFIGFIGSINPVTIFGGVLASCLALGIMWELMQAVRTKEHKITKRDTQEVLDEISNTLSKDKKCIKSLVLKYSNGSLIAYKSIIIFFVS